MDDAIGGKSSAWAGAGWQGSVSLAAIRIGDAPEKGGRTPGRDVFSWKDEAGRRHDGRIAGVRINSPGVERPGGG
jgi:hypothetical protein